MAVPAISAIVMVLLGTVLLATAFFPLRKILANPESPQGWRFLVGLVYLFILGYLFYALRLLAQPATQLDLAVATILMGGGVFVAVVCRLSERSLSSQWQKAKAADHLALHDELTGLPNRRLFMTRLEADLASSDQSPQGASLPLSLLILDCNRFKDINDTLGHLAGDRLLQEVARMLSELQRTEDMVARLSGDEFVLLLPRTDLPEAAAVAEIVCKAFDNPISVEGNEVSLSVSVGIANAPQHASEPAELLRCADVAMYDAKRNQKPATIFEKNMTGESRQRLWGAVVIRNAIDQKEFTLACQPQYDLRSGTLVGAEALLRWRSGQFDNMGPQNFVALAERVGLIRPLSDAVIALVAQDFPAWAKVGVPIWVNLSAYDLSDPQLTDRVLRVLDSAGIATSLFGIEITETAMLVDQSQAMQNAERLAGEGIRLAIDDFGTGYSTLSHLAQFPVSKIKIDREFTSGLEEGNASLPIIKACIDMAHELLMSVTAEGVETAEQLSAIRGLGCDVGQGYLLDRPMTIERFVQQHAVAATYTI